MYKASEGSTLIFVSPREVHETQNSSQQRNNMAPDGAVSCTAHVAKQKVPFVSGWGRERVFSRGGTVRGLGKQEKL